MKQQEHNLQVGCINWFRLQYPKYIIYAIPNGGQRNAIVAAKMKAEGVLSGTPDLCIPVAKGGYHALYIELKVGKNKPTNNQISVMEKLQNEGYKCEVCYSFDEFQKIVAEYMRT
ncbi:MAG: VRR-NUC domain-containing protein [Paludibacter sp.]|nr:VRR-NUC domain-containing protein [Paludibacter sp.]